MRLTQKTQPSDMTSSCLPQTASLLEEPIYQLALKVLRKNCINKYRSNVDLLFIQLARPGWEPICMKYYQDEEEGLVEILTERKYTNIDKVLNQFDKYLCACIKLMPTILMENPHIIWSEYVVECIKSYYFMIEPLRGPYIAKCSVCEKRTLRTRKETELGVCSRCHKELIKQVDVIAEKLRKIEETFKK